MEEQVEEYVSDFLRSQTSESKHIENIKSKVLKLVSVELGDYIFTNIDTAFIERCYIETCVELWLEYVAMRTKSLEITRGKTSNIEEIINLISIRNFKISDLPERYKSSEYVDLLVSSKLLTKNVESEIIAQFRKTFASNLAILNDLLEEISFYEDLLITIASNYLETMDLFKTIQRFADNQDTMETFLGNIVTFFSTNSDNGLHLTYRLSKLLDIGIFWFTENARRLLPEVYKRATIIEKEEKGRKFLLVQGGVYTISEVLHNLNSTISKNPQIKEVHFIADYSIIIDSSIDQNIWHGKNIVLITKVITVQEKCTWDISGNSGRSVENAYQGSRIGKDGRDGMDGYAGESGGNCFIHADKIVGGENWTIVSNGGNGSKGSSGEDGANGRDGNGLKGTDLKEVAYAVYYAMEFLFSDAVRALLNRGKYEQSAPTKKHDFLVEVSSSDDYYLHVSGHNLTGKIYYYDNNATKIRFIFILHGEAGESGGAGGQAGLGGEAGFAGEIELSENVAQISNLGQAGSAGADGIGGLSGKPGKEGWDVGYKYFEHTAFYSNENFYGESEQEKLELSWSESEWETRPSHYIWDQQNQKYLRIRYKTHINTAQNQYRKTRNFHRKTREQHSKAERKKIIASDIMLNIYEKQNVTSLKELSNVKNDLQNILDRAKTKINETAETRSQYSRLIQQPNSHTVFYLQQSYSYEEITLISSYSIFLLNLGLGIAESFFNNEFLLKKAILAYNVLPIGKYKMKAAEKLLKYTSKYSFTSIDKSEIERFKGELVKLVKYEKLSDIDSKLLGSNINDAAMPFPIPNNFKRYLLEIDNESSSDEQELKSSILNQDATLILGKFLNGTQVQKHQYNMIFSQFTTEIFELTDSLQYETDVDFSEKIEQTDPDELTAQKHHDTDNRMIDSSFYDKVDAYFGSCYKVRKNIISSLNLKSKTFEEAQSVLKNFDWTDPSLREKSKDIISIMLEQVRIWSYDSKIYRDILSCVFEINFVYYSTTDDDDEPSFSVHLFDKETFKKIFFLNEVSQGEMRLTQFNSKLFYLEQHLEHKSVKCSKILNYFLNLDNEYLIRNFNVACVTGPTDEKLQIEGDGYSDTAVEEACIKRIHEILTNQKHSQFEKLLGKLRSAYVGSSIVVVELANRLEIEGLQISIESMCSFLSDIVDSISNDIKIFGYYAWIIATVPQHFWIVEQIMIRLQRIFYQELRPKYLFVKNLLENVKSRQSLQLIVQYIDDTHCREDPFINLVDSIELLTQVHIDIQLLANVMISDWHYILVQKKYENELLQIAKDYNADYIALDAYRLKYLADTYGKSQVDSLLDDFRNKENLSYLEISSIINNIANNERDINLLTHSETDESVSVCSVRKLNDGSRDVCDIKRFILKSTNTSENITKNLDIIELLAKKVIDLRSSYAMFSLQEAISNIRKIQDEFDGDLTDFDERLVSLIGWIDKVIKDINKWNLRDTQIITILLILKNDKNLLAEVSTGEGKTVIVATVAIVKALHGKKVDIITSSTVLAKRDAEQGCRDIYDAIGIKVGHNCGEDIGDRRDSYSQNTVIYGTISSFQRDYLLDRFYNQNILGDRSFDTVIVDEVDSMLLDKGNNVLYLSHDLPGIDALEAVFVAIWQQVNLQTDEEIYDSDIKEAILPLLVCKFRMDDFIYIGPNLSKEEENTIWDDLVRSRIIDDSGTLLELNVNLLNQMQLSTLVQQYDRSTKFFLANLINRGNRISIPQYLKDFAVGHLDSWIQSSITAKFMTENEDYIVDADRSRTSPDRHAVITIIDRDTGTDLASSQWDEALHQFLQLKHGCRLTPISLKAVYISNVTYFKKYTNLFGLTGTLGSKIEREFLLYIHNVDFVIVPTFREKKFTEYLPLSYNNIGEWLGKIAHNCIEMITKNRSVLIICDSINTVNTIHKYISLQNITNIKIYTREHDEFDYSDTKLQTKSIVIATNLAGRGADIKISKELKSSGGLHVLLSYLPSNLRVERQAFGRAARSGDPGSGKMIVFDPACIKYCAMSIGKLKVARDTAEVTRVSNLKAYYSYIQMEENFLEEIQKIYANKRALLTENVTTKEIREIFLRSCLDKWAYWLDQNVKYNKQNDTRGLIGTSFDTFSSSLQRLSYQSEDFPSHEVCSMWLMDDYSKIKVAKILLTEKKHNEAADILRAIGKNSVAADVVAYYLSAAICNEIQWDKRDTSQVHIEFNDKNRELYREMLKNLEFAFSRFEEKYIQQNQFASTIRSIRNNSLTANRSITVIESYFEQKEKICQIYAALQQNIEGILGKKVKSDSFVSTEQECPKFQCRSPIDQAMSKAIFDVLKDQNYIFKSKRKENFAKIGTDLERFNITPSQLKSFLEEQTSFDLNNVRNMLQDKFSFKTRDTLWQKLKLTGVLKNELKYAQIDFTKLEMYDPSFADSLRSDKCTAVDIDSLASNVIIKHSFGNSVKFYPFNQISDTFSLNRIEKLKQASVLSDNFFAEYDVPSSNKFKMVHRWIINVSDFEEEFIDIATAHNLVKHLCEISILKETHNGFLCICAEDELSNLEQLPNYCQMYQVHIIKVLKRHFMLQYAFDDFRNHMVNIGNMKSPLNMKRSNELNYRVFCPQLATSPQDQLLAAMIQENIIPNFSVGINTDNVISHLEKYFKNKLTIAEIEQSIIDEGLVTETNIATLRKELVEKNWLLLSDKGSEQTVEIPDESKHGPSLPLTARFNDITKSLRMWFNKRDSLTRTDELTNISKLLESWKTELAKYENPEASLKNFEEIFNENPAMQEVGMFIQNALDHVIVLAEKKWTIKMILSSIAVIVMGIVQCAIGLAIMVFSSGSMTHAAQAFVGEGIGDIIYGIQSLATGTFSWKDYGYQKLISLAMSAVSFGVGAAFSGGAKVSRLGFKAAGHSFSVGGKSVAQTTGKKLIETLGKKVVIKESLKIFAKQFSKQMSFSLANQFIGPEIINSLKGFAKSIADLLYSKIEEKIREHKLMQTLYSIMTELGVEQKVILQQLNKNLQDLLVKDGAVKKDALKHLDSSFNAVQKGLSQAIKKNKKIFKSSKILDFTFKVVSYADDIFQVARHVEAISSFSVVVDRILTALNNFFVKQYSFKEVTIQSSEKLDEIIRQVSSDFKQHSHQIVTENFISPLVQFGQQQLINNAASALKSNYKKFQSFRHKREFKRTKESYEKKKDQGEDIDETQEKYIIQMNKLMSRVRDPKLLAEIIGEGTPMNTACMNAAVHVLARELNENITIVVETEHEDSVRYSSNIGSSKNREVHLKLKDYHFVGGDMAVDNNCFFEALATQIPNLKMNSAVHFRKKIQFSIVNDPDVKTSIRYGWHEFSMKREMYGGAINRKRKRGPEDYDPPTGTLERDLSLISKSIEQLSTTVPIEQKPKDDTSSTKSTLPEQKTTDKTSPTESTLPEQKTTDKTSPTESTLPEQKTTDKTSPTESTLPEQKTTDKMSPTESTLPEQKTKDKTSPTESTLPKQRTTDKTSPTESTLPEQKTKDETSTPVTYNTLGKQIINIGQHMLNTKARVEIFTEGDAVLKVASKNGEKIHFQLDNKTLNENGMTKKFIQENFAEIFQSTDKSLLEPLRKEEYIIYGYQFKADKSKVYIGITGRSFEERKKEHIRVIDGNIKKPTYIRKVVESKIIPKLSEGSGNADNEGSGNADSKSSGNADSKSSGNADIKSSGNADSKSSGNADSKSSGNADSKSSGNADSKSSSNADSKSSGNADNASSSIPSENATFFPITKVYGKENARNMELLLQHVTGAQKNDASGAEKSGTTADGIGPGGLSQLR